MADCRFVDPVAAHELFHDRLGKELIKPRLLQSALTRDRAQGCAAAAHRHPLDRTASCPRGPHYSTKVCPARFAPGGFLKKRTSGRARSVKIISSLKSSM